MPIHMCTLINNMYVLMLKKRHEFGKEGSDFCFLVALLIL